MMPRGSAALARLLIAIGLATVLIATLSPAASLGSSSCVVRNVSQHTHARSLVSMVERAHDGDVLRVRGGIFTGQRATLEVSGSLIRDNRARFGGGGFYKHGLATITGSMVTSNTARYGAGIENAHHQLDLIDSMVTGNTARKQGGGIANFGRVTIEASSVTGNVPDACVGPAAC